MAAVVMMKGLPATGKSTFAKVLLGATSLAGQHDVARVNRDLLREMLHNGVYSPENEEIVLAAEKAVVKMLLRRGLTVLVDDTNLADGIELVWKGLAVTEGASFEVSDFTNVPVDVAVERDAQRPNPVGEDVIRGMAARYGLG